MQKQRNCKAFLNILDYFNLQQLQKIVFTNHRIDKNPLGKCVCFLCSFARYDIGITREHYGFGCNTCFYHQNRDRFINDHANIN